MSERLESEQQSSLRLVRWNPAQRMARFYALHIAPTLFGDWDLVREWGRIDSPGTLRIDTFEKLEECAHACLRIEKKKRKRGHLE